MFFIFAYSDNQILMKKPNQKKQVEQGVEAFNSFFDECGPNDDVKRVFLEVLFEELTKKNSVRPKEKNGKRL